MFVGGCLLTNVLLLHNLKTLQPLQTQYIRTVQMRKSEKQFITPNLRKPIILLYSNLKPNFNLTEGLFHGAKTKLIENTNKLKQICRNDWFKISLGLPFRQLQENLQLYSDKVECFFY